MEVTNDLRAKAANRQAALKVRVENVIQILGHKDFTAQQVANALSADRYDVLFALHALVNDRKVEHLNSTEAVFADKWRRFRGGYTPEPVPVHPIADWQACKA